jgi:hypothetical protein
VTNLDAQA